MSESAQQPQPTSSAPGAQLNAIDRRALHEARGEAVIILAADVALLGGLAAVDKAKDWDIIDLPWWAWLLIASPALLLMILLLAVPLAELSPGRVRKPASRCSDSWSPPMRRRRDPPRRPRGKRRREPERRRAARPRSGRLAHQHHHLRTAVLDARRRRTARPRRTRAVRPGLPVPTGRSGDRTGVHD